MTISSFFRNVFKKVMFEYEIYRVFKIETKTVSIPAKQPTSYQFVEISGDSFANDPLYIKNCDYDGEQSVGFGLIADGNLVGVQWYWYGQRYLKRNSWPLPVAAIKSVYMEVDANHQNLGLGTLLKALSMKELDHKEFKYVYSRVWHNNRPSIAMNHKLKAKQVGFLIYLFKGKKLKFRIPKLWTAK